MAHIRGVHAPRLPPPWLPPSRPESRVGSSAVRGRETPSLYCGATRSEAVGRREPGTAGVPGDSTRGTDGRTGTDLSAGSHLLHRVPLGWPGVSRARARAPPTSPLPSGCWRPGWPNGRATPDRGRSRLTPSPCVVSHIGGRRHRVNVRGALVWAHQRAQSLPPTIAHGETLYPTPMGNPSAR